MTPNPNDKCELCGAVATADGIRHDPDCPHAYELDSLFDTLGDEEADENNVESEESNEDEDADSEPAADSGSDSRYD